MKEMNTTYEPNTFSGEIYSAWESSGSFKPQGNGEPFTIVIPPPNVTGVLHMGHGLNGTLQDILIRYQRMRGRRALWLPGSDHAGIATQNVVERQLREKGISKDDLGRNAFVEETWKVKEKHHRIITDQFRKIGASCDWSRERFTMDEGLSNAVREVFVRLCEEGLIYRGERLINWCASCGTALSDDEVEHKETGGKLYTIRYPYASGNGSLTIATTRPETLFGDTAVAVHPEDKRYTEIIGKELILPLTKRTIPVIGDLHCDPEFGSGAVKVTPAHDPNDWEIGERHALPKINILTPEGSLNEEVPEEFRGLPIDKARKRTVEALEREGYLIQVEERPHQVGRCYRCDSVVEPYISKQWFVKMKPLAEEALDALHTGEIAFYPKRWENTYTHWLENIRDWCISRQLWWGHRIPAWHCSCGETIVTRIDPTLCPACGSKNLEQDEDVLDTWFSSWLWPFSTLGWPDQSEDMKTFYPTSALVTAYDIIFFWVARMIMAGKHFTGRAPFQHIYITPLVRDKQGRKMSKSLGNGIDPLEVVEEFGADALKFTIAYLSVQGQDLPMDKETFRLGSRFCNKIWNAVRFMLISVEGKTLPPPEDLTYSPIDKWILHRLNTTICAVQKGFNNYRFDETAHAVYEFFWNDFCDWYLEAAKVSLNGTDLSEKDRTAGLLCLVLEETLRLLHPFTPFISEELARRLPSPYHNGNLVITSPYPTEIPGRNNPGIEASFGIFQRIVGAARTLRSEFGIPPNKEVSLLFSVEDEEALNFCIAHTVQIKTLVHASSAGVFDGETALSGSIASAGKGFEIRLFIRDLIDVNKEIKRLEKAITKTKKLHDATERKILDERFLSRAPQDIIQKEREKLGEHQFTLDKMTGYLDQLKTD